MWRGWGKIQQQRKYSNVTTIGVIINMKFEWDAEKNKTNIRKHGIDFSDAWQIFEHPLFVWHDDRFDYGEDRYIGIGMLNNMTVVLAAFVEKDIGTIRVISMRKAKKHEREKYEEAVKNGLGAA
jgi:uncharacterized protein